MALVNENFNTHIADSVIGSQFWTFDKTSKKFIYIVPVKEGGSINGTTETIDLVQADKLTIGKLSGRFSLEQITYETHFTVEKYKRLNELVKSTELGIYLDFMGKNKAGFMIIANGNAIGKTTTETFNIPIVLSPSDYVFIDNCLSLTAEMATKVNSYVLSVYNITLNLAEGDSLPFDNDTVPSSHENNTTLPV